MNRNRVVNSAEDILFSQGSYERIAVLSTDGIDVVNMPGVISLGRCDYIIHVCQKVIIELGILPSCFVPCRKMLQFHTQHRSLEAVHASIPADYGVIVLLGLTVITEHAYLFSEFGVVSHNGTSFYVYVASQYSVTSGKLEVSVEVFFYCAFALTY